MVYLWPSVSGVIFPLLLCCYGRWWGARVVCLRSVWPLIRLYSSQLKVDHSRCFYSLICKKFLLYSAVIIDPYLRHHKMKVLFRKSEEDLGTGKCQFAWRPGGTYIAIAGANNNVQLFDRTGELLDAVQLPGTVVDMAWDKEGDVLAIIHDKSSLLVLWDINTRTTEQLETSMGSKELPLVLMWSPKEPILVVGNNNGNMLIYNHRHSKKIPMLGKHQRRITCGAISGKDLIALGSDDSSITINGMDGNTQHTLTCSAEPSHIQFSEMKRANAERGGQTDLLLSAVLGKKILMLVNVEDTDNPINLQFQTKYGDIVGYAWYSDGYMVIGFERGFIVCISAHQSEIGQEIFSLQEFKTYLADIKISTAFGKIISAGDHQLKLREIDQSQETFQIIDVDTDSELTQVDCNFDGTLLAVTSSTGAMCVYLTKMPLIGAAYKDTIAILSNLAEVTVLPEGDKINQCTVPVLLEPSVLAVGPEHIAIAANNRVWFYDYMNSSGQPVSQYEYLSTVQQVLLNGTHAAVLTEGSARLHTIVESEGDERSQLFPEAERQARIVAAAINDDFFIFTTDTNYLVYFAVDEWAVVNEFRHSSLIRKVFPEPGGIRAALFDERLHSYVYSPIDDSMHPLPAVGSAVHTDQSTTLSPNIFYKSVMWETFTIDRETIVVADQANLYVFLLAKNNIDGDPITFVGTTKLPYGHTPLMLSKGIVHCLTTSGRPSSVLLESHKTDTVLEGKSAQMIEQLLAQALKLKRWMYAWKICDFTKEPIQWQQFARAAMQSSDVQLASRIFRHIGEVSMVDALDEIQDIDEKALVAGHLALLCGDFDSAERHFLNSSQPVEALDMRRDLLHWSRALELAEKLAPAQIPHICKEYAQQLEFMGDSASALHHYEEGILKDVDEDDIQNMEHNEICRSGVARMCIKTGDLQRGIKMASELHGRVVKKECAMILEQLKQFNDAAYLYEIGQFYDRAAVASLRAKNWNRVGELLPKVRSPKIHAQYGRVMEAEKKYKQAAVAYKNAKDYDSLVRVLLDHLDMPDEAVKIVKESRSAEGAKLVAKFFTKLGDHSAAIQFLIISQCHQEAFHLAESADKMEDYAEALGDSGTTEQYAQLAEYFANTGNMLGAGKFHYKAGHYAVAMDYLLSMGENEEALINAVECVAVAHDHGLTHRLAEYLLGEKDGVPKEAKYLFRMYSALGMIREAARTAVVIAKEEQSRGNYRAARDLLFSMHMDLMEKNIRVPQEMQHSLLLIHSYLLVRVLLRKEDGVGAARMLIRVINGISSFPAHAVAILTSAVVLCSQAGLKTSAHRYAVQLMAPEYRDKIDAKYKKKIEQIVRKSEKAPDPEDPKTDCPYCSTSIPSCDLSCTTCKNTIPYCIITGHHVVRDDFAVCPTCNFPGHFSQFKKLAAAKDHCPMCGSDNMGQALPMDFTNYLNKERGKSDE